MYGIKINNEYVDLTPGQSVKLTRWNSIFDFETVRGSIVNDFTVPFTPKNDKIFGWFRNPKMRLPNKSFYAEKIADGYIIERGFVDLVDCTESEYVLAFTQNLSEVFGQYQTSLLPQMPFGGTAGINAVKAADHLTDAVCWPTVRNTAFYGTNYQEGYNGKMNDWASGAINSNARVPMVFMRWFFEKVAELCDFRFHGSFFDSELFKRMVIINTRSLDDEAVINFASHLPEITLPEMIKELRRLFNLAIYFDVNNRVMYAHFANELMMKPVKLNWTNKVTPSAARTPERANRLQLDWELDGNDNLMKAVPLPAGFDKYIAPETQIGSIFEVTTRCSTIAEIDGMAAMEQIGVSTRFNQAGAKFGLRVGLWAGVINNVPTVTNNYGGYRIAWSGENNLAEKCFGNYETLRAKTSYKNLMANLNAMDLYRIDWHNNPNAEQAVFIDGKEYYIDRVEVILPLTGQSLLSLVEKP